MIHAPSLTHDAYTMQYFGKRPLIPAALREYPEGQNGIADIDDD